LAKQSGEFVITSTTDSAEYPDYGQREGVAEGVAKVLNAYMSPTALERYDGVFFLHTSGQLPIPDMPAFLDWIKQGHGVMGSHAASDCFHQTDTPEEAHTFIQMLGGEFAGHGAQETVELHNFDADHPANKHLPSTVVVHDEMYLFKHYDRTTVHSLLNMVEHPNERTPGHYPVSWCKDYGQGRVFYTSLGHREDMWDAGWRAGQEDRRNPPLVSEQFRGHLLGGIRWALGLDQAESAAQINSSN
jgi:type 1 glutamine amidotransferase